MIDLARLLARLCDEGVHFILIGGAAATAHGSSRLTQDLDVVYDRDASNTERLAAALASLNPYLRGAPPGLPFQWDARTIRQGLNFTLTTSLGDIDLFGEIAGGGGYADLAPHCVTLTVFGHEVQCLGIEKLIEVKRAAGRAKDLEAIAELEEILEEQQR